MTTAAIHAAKTMDMKNGKYSNVDWNTIDWPGFHKLFPEVSRASYYTYRANNKTTPDGSPAVPAVLEIDDKALQLTDIQQKICQAIMAGDTETEAAEKNNISLMEHLKWKEDTARPYDFMIKKSLEVARMRLRDNMLRNVITWGNRNWVSSGWVLERMFPSEFAKKEGGTGPNIGVAVKLTVATRQGKDITSQVKVETQAQPGPQPAIADRGQVKKLNQPEPNPHVSTDDDIDISSIIDDKEL
jgi:hypothetical protein